MAFASSRGLVVLLGLFIIAAVHAQVPGDVGPTSQPVTKATVTDCVVEYGPFSECSESCGGGTKQRSVVKIITPPSDGGIDCPPKTDTRPCTKQECPAFPISIDRSCINCLCLVSSNCYRGNSCHDAYAGCGYFQITYPFFLDCGCPGISRGSDSCGLEGWKTCSLDYDCSVTCIEKYMQIYAGRCTKNQQQPTCENVVKIHKAGPWACNSTLPFVDEFWQKVHNCLLVH